MSVLAPSRSRLRVLFLLLVAASAVSVRPSLASCSPPEVAVRPGKVQAGGILHVSGAGWADGCVEPREAGCGADEPRAASPVAAIAVTLVPAGDRGGAIELGTVDADDDYAFRLEAVVPPATRPGRYRLEVRSGGHVAATPVTIAGE